MSISRAGADKLRRVLRQWSAAIILSVEEHGAPNGFGVRELAGKYRLDPRDGYRLGQTRILDLRLWLEPKGLTVSYVSGRFLVEVIG